METHFYKNAHEWVQASAQSIPSIDPSCFCETRDMFQARYDKMTSELLAKKLAPDHQLYLISAIVGEIGNNSFDHNLGNWPDVMGVFFCYTLTENEKSVVIADRGQGIFATLKKVKPALQTSEEALATAFTEKISGRAPENRGNGLKFVRQSVEDQQLHLTFLSGNGKAELNDHMRTESTDAAIHGCLAILIF